MKKNILIKAIRCTVCGLLLTVCGFAGEVHGQAVAALGADTIALGDQTTLSIRRALNYPSLEMLSRDGIVAISQEYDSISKTQTTILTSFEPGEHVIRLSQDDSLVLVVKDVEIDSATAELRDIAPIEKVPYTFWEIFRWVLLALVIGGVGFGVWWLVKNHKRVRDVLVPPAPVDTRTPERRALDNLEALRLKRLWQNGKIKEYHTELTDIVRTFIEEATGIRATELTSVETIEAIEGEKWGTESGLLRSIFGTADLVKFAKDEPDGHVHERSLTEAAEFISALWEKAKPTENEENGKEAADA